MPRALPIALVRCSARGGTKTTVSAGFAVQQPAWTVVESETYPLGGYAFIFTGDGDMDDLPFSRGEIQVP